MQKTVMILGTKYSVEKKKYGDDQHFEEEKADGYCDDIEKKIVYCDMSTYPGWEKDAAERCLVEEKHTLRHEVIHAFLSESGLEASSGVCQNGWALNEEMFDWMALQFPKILDVYKELGII